MAEKLDFILFKNHEEVTVQLGDVAGGQLDGMDFVSIALPRENAEPLRIAFTIDGALSIAAKLTFAVLKTNERNRQQMESEGGHGSA
jgi:hypothetical protein